MTTDKDLGLMIAKAMSMAEDVSNDSNCNSRKIGCVIVNENGKPLTFGFNMTTEPVCLLGVCNKRYHDEGKGHSVFCHATHAEEMAAKKLQYLMKNRPVVLEAMGGVGKTYAVMTCGYPCRFCLEDLHGACVDVLVLANDGFYCEEDENAWHTFYEDKFEVIIYGGAETGGVHRGKSG